MARIAVFAYGSLVDRPSAALTLGREVERLWTARLGGWRRRFSQARNNRECEKAFASAEDGSVPSHVLGLNIEYAYCHTASLPVAINVQCWAARRGTVRIHPDGKLEFPTHREVS